MAMSFSRTKSLSATEKILRHLTVSYEDGTNLEAREGMLQGAFEAGLAFTRANVGNCHAIAHQFGGMFNTPHGIANSMLLPHILEHYLQDEFEGGDAPFCTTKYCELAQVAGLAPNYSADMSVADKRAIAQKFVARVAQMSVEMAIPTEVKGMKASDVAEVANRALRETNGEQHSFFQKPIAAILDLGYAVPRYMTHDDCKRVIAKLLPADEKQKYIASIS